MEFIDLNVVKSLFRCSYFPIAAKEMARMFCWHVKVSAAPAQVVDGCQTAGCAVNLSQPPVFCFEQNQFSLKADKVFPGKKKINKKTFFQVNPVAATYNRAEALLL